MPSFALVLVWISVDTHGPDGLSPTGPVHRFSPFAQALQQFAQRSLSGSNQTKWTKLRYKDWMLLTLFAILRSNW